MEKSTGASLFWKPSAPGERLGLVVVTDLPLACRCTCRAMLDHPKSCRYEPVLALYSHKLVFGRRINSFLAKASIPSKVQGSVLNNFCENGAESYFHHGEDGRGGPNHNLVHVPGRRSEPAH